MHTVIRSSFVVIGIGCSFLFGVQWGAHHTDHRGVLHAVTSAPVKPPQDVDMSPLWKAWSVLEEKFVPATTTMAITDEEKVWGAIQGVARSYKDPYTIFLPPAENEFFSEEINGVFGGVGMEIGYRDGALIVIAPLKGTPAERAGILAGDYIVEIDGQSSDGLSVDAAVRLIRGEPGSEVHLRLARREHPELIDVTVVREQIKTPTIKTAHRADGVFVIELYTFGATAPVEFRNALRDFVLSGSTKLVVDLRGNPGGYLEAAVDIASWFLPMGKTVVREHFGDARPEVVHRSRGYNIYKPHWRVVVLVDRGSASASEIVAGAWHEHGVATLVGEKTFGKGSVQELVRITPTTSLKVTIARWLTPNGVSISENGLTPDFVVSYSREDRDAGSDPQFERALEYLRTGK